MGYFPIYLSLLPFFHQCHIVFSVSISISLSLYIYLYLSFSWLNLPLGILLFMMLLWVGLFLFQIVYCWCIDMEPIFLCWIFFFFLALFRMQDPRVPYQGSNPHPAVETQSLNLWTAREVSLYVDFVSWNFTKFVCFNNFFEVSRIY